MSRTKKFMITLGAFLLLGISFKAMVLVEGLTEVRPVNAVPPVAGLLWGFTGAAACGLGNLLADMAGTFSEASILGIIGNFAAAWLPYRLWYLYRKEAPNLHSSRNIVCYCFVCAVSAMTSAWFLSIGLYVMEEIWYEEIYRYVFFNNLGFSIGLGMPVLIMLTADCVEISCCPAPRRYLILRDRAAKAVLPAVYTALMLVICGGILFFHSNPIEHLWMRILSGASLILLMLLSI